MTHFSFVATVAFAFTGAFSTVLSAQSIVDRSADTVVITLAEAQRLALTQNPAFLAQSQENAIARGQLRQARVYPFNPRLEVETPGASTDGIGETQALLSQEVEWAGQRGLRIRSADLGVDRAQYYVRNAARETLAATTDAYYSATAAQRRVGVAVEIFELAKRLLDATRIQVREGEISVMEANLAEIEFGRSRARVLSTEREALSTRLELQRLTGIEPQRTVRLVSDGLVPLRAPLLLDSLLSTAQAQRPDIIASARETERSDLLVSLARREAMPNVEVGAMVSRAAVESNTSPRIGFVVALPVPFWNRNQGVIAERIAQAQQSALFQRSTELAVRIQVTEAYRAYAAASEEARVFERDVRDPARANQRLLEEAFRAGKIGLPTMLLLRNQLLDAELGYWDTWLEERRAYVRLAAATGDLNMEMTQSRGLNDR